MENMEKSIELEFNKMVVELQDLEKKIQQLSINGIRINEELAATVEILKTQIDRIGTK